jgi:SAM-dependent methyltransferase
MDESTAGRRYELIGGTYASTRRTDPRIAARIEAALGDARTIVNVGAGAGSYEPAGREVIPIEPSPTMAAQRPASLPQAVIARAEALPLADDSADAAMAIITLHHWDDVAAGIREMRRVARERVVILTLDPNVMARSWLRDYAPELRRFDSEFPSVEQIAAALGGAAISEIPSPSDCVDLFIETMLGRPELLLDPEIRANCSGFARMDDAAEARAVELLRADLDSGEWDSRHGHLRSMAEHDGGLRLLVAEA